MAAYYASILYGALLTVGVSLAALLVSVLLGLLGAGAKLSGSRLLVALATGYTTIIRGIPELVLMLLVALLTLMDEVRSAQGWEAARRSIAAVPEVVGGALRLIQASALLTALVVAELLWGFGVIAYEGLLPPRLAEVTGRRLVRQGDDDGAIEGSTLVFTVDALRQVVEGRPRMAA